MKIKELWNKIRKGVKAGMAAATESNVLTDNRVVSMIEKFKASGKYELMKEGERYYQADNDIKNRKITRKVDGHKEEETWRANNKLAHAKYKIQVDEKIAYLLTKPVTYKTDGADKNDTYVEKVKDVLGKHFQYQLTQLGYEASNKGIGWLHVYLDPEGELKTIVIPAEQCIPYWSDRSHTELDAMIRVYNTTVWQYNQEKEITNVEIWTKDGVKYYRLEGQMLVYDNDKSMDAGGPVAHYKSVEEWKTWGKVPFIPFKNNQIEMPDIKFVKSLIDGYDLGRSEAANYMDEVKNLIFVLKGYGGQNLSDFIKQLNEDRAILIDDAEDGGVDTLTPQMDITALREHYEQLNRDIVESGQSVNKDLDKFGSAPSGVALKFMYSSLDLKCNLSLNDILLTGLQQGKTTVEIAIMLHNRMGQGFNECHRLVRTETMHYLNDATLQRYKDADVKYVQILAAKDERTCDICGGYHEKVYPIEECVHVPLHANCRCTIIPVTDEKLIAAYEKNHPDELESDIGQKIVDHITGISKQRKMFEQKVKNINDIRVRTLLTQSLERTTIKRAKGRKSKYSASEKTVYLAKNAKVDTLAHELFHEIDDAYGLIENGLLSKSVISDYNKLQNLAKGYGKSIEEMLYSRYPKAFRKDTEKLALKEEYRGISDILNGMSSGEINLGYWHDKEYWKKTGRVEAESFAQFGRALYGGNPEVLDMFKSLFPNSYDEVSGRIERLIK